MSALYHDSQHSPTKQCNRCKVVKPLDEFYNDKHKRDGHSTLCKECILSPKVITQLPLILFEQTCNKCNITKPISEFYETKGTRFGYNKQCKSCVREAANQYHKETYIPSPQRGRPNQSSPQTSDGMKMCLRCHEVKPIDAFGFQKRNTDGLKSYCRMCDPRCKTGRKRNWQKVTERGTKICTRCGIEKPLAEFSKRSTKKGTYAAMCKICFNEYHAVHYAQSDKEEIKKKNHQWYQNNSERHYQSVKEWKQRHPYHVAETNRRVNAFRRQVTAYKVDYEAIIERDGLTCYICGKDIDPAISKMDAAGLTFDHVKPLAGKGERKGTHTEDNIRPAHRVCNIRKSARLLSELSDYQRRGP